MRFLANGPSIPDTLLEHRDQGRVVFFCGAGVSQQAGLPSFVKLTKRVIEALGVQPDSPITKAFEPCKDSDESSARESLDHIFERLDQGYGRDVVRVEVAKHLAERERDSSLAMEGHRLVADISSDTDHRPQIVTTNFDRLFERAMGEDIGPAFELQGLPDLGRGDPIQGITHLHGRLRDPACHEHDYILSAKDFGRAYISDGWATRFIKSLLDSYSVVLVGYSADDPLVDYLLRGLHHDGPQFHTNLYALSTGSRDDVERRWRGRGAHPIPYRNRAALWSTLKAWAERARDPAAWKRKVVQRAKNGPRELAAHERGQVAHLLRTVEGARLFTEGDDSPTTEWLCVFDDTRRRKLICNDPPDNGSSGDDYRLDDDPDKATANRKLLQPEDRHLLEWVTGDPNPTNIHRLGQQWGDFNYSDLPPRILHLADWIAGHLHEPVTLWWVLHQRSLHPVLFDRIRNAHDRDSTLCEEARRHWRLALEFLAGQRHFLERGSRHDAHLPPRAEQGDWHPGALRLFEAATAPALELPPYQPWAHPPGSSDWRQEDREFSSLWKVALRDNALDQVSVPDEALESVVRIAENHLWRAIGLYEDIGGEPPPPPPTYYPDQGVTVPDARDDTALVFEWLLFLFKSLVGRLPQATDGHPTGRDSLRARVAGWPIEERRFFRKLKLFAWNQKSLFEVDEVAGFLRELDQDCFWDPKVVAELLILIRDRWPELDGQAQEELYGRLLAGPEGPAVSDTAVEADTRKRMRAACYVKWLQSQDLPLSTEQSEQLEGLISQVPGWQDRWARDVISEGDADSVWPTPAPWGDNDAIDREITNLVEENPRRAMACLLLAAQRGDHSLAGWGRVISKLDIGGNVPLYRVFLRRIQGLPHDAVHQLLDPLSTWIDERFDSAYRVDTKMALGFLCWIVRVRVAADNDGMIPGIDEDGFRDDMTRPPHKSWNRSLNSPIGKAARRWVCALRRLNLAPGSGLPDEFRELATVLLTATTRDGDNGLTTLTKEIDTLYRIDPSWVLMDILPLFDLDSPMAEPAWNGYLLSEWRKVHPGSQPPEIDRRLFPELKRLFCHFDKWGWSTGNDVPTQMKNAAIMVVDIGVYRRGNPCGLTDMDLRRCLLDMNDPCRQQAIMHLSGIGNRTGWEGDVIPFINEIWPRETRIQNSGLFTAWLRLLAEAGDAFPLMLKVLTAPDRRYLKPVAREHHWLYLFVHGSHSQPVATEHPKEVLEMLDVVVDGNPDHTPPQLLEALQLIQGKRPELAEDKRFVRLMKLTGQN